MWIATGAPTVNPNITAANPSRNHAMFVKQLMTTQITSCSPGDPLDHAARLMWEHDCGCLPVCVADGANRVAGIITDRDVCMSALFQGKPLRDMRVSDAMTAQVRTCRPTDSLADVEHTMRAGKIRRLPVVDDEGSLVGMITLADLAREADREQEPGSAGISNRELGATLASICQPPHHELAAA
jgi:CBS domain-containing protein